MKSRALASFLLIMIVVGGCYPSPREKEEAPARTYTNPVSLPDEWGEYGLGDPFILSHNGYFYLYVSTRDTDIGVKVWRSTNLTEWSYQGLCTEDPLTMGAYAPEVRYWNGKFYMYTSPAGQGDYILESDSPTGPFRIVTENIGRTIDGSTFVDDDGQWYFYYAGPQGIQAVPMDDPVTISQEGTLTGAFMGGWTEGPTVFKRHGKYYMTYTGNHVFSKGYRVNAAVSDSPLHGFQGMDDNPVLIRAEGKTVGLGHNSIVRGPDLDSQYMVYHNLEGPGVVGPLRHMNLDRIAWNGGNFSVWGPTSEPQQAPEPPAFSDRFERDEVGSAWNPKGDGSWSVNAKEGLLADATGEEGRAWLVSKKETEDDRYTAEFHWQIDSPHDPKSKSGALFAYSDDKNYGMVLFHPATGEIEARLVKDGESVLSEKSKLPAGYDFSKLHLLRLEKSGDSLRVYADEMQKLVLDLKQHNVRGGSVGYVAENAKARFGYVAFSNEVDGSSDAKAYQPVPGNIDGGRFEGTNRVNVTQSGEYSFHFRLIPGAQGVKFHLENEEGTIMPTVEAPAGKAGQEETASVHSVKLQAGFQRWKLVVEDGSMDLSSVWVTDYTAVTTKQDDFEDRNDFGWTRYEGAWSVREGQLRASSVQPAKTTFGEFGWADYTFEADLTVPEPNGQNGMLVRVTEPANGYEQNQNRPDFLRGYYVYLDSAGIHLAKHNYDTVVLADAPYELPASGSKVHLKVRVTGPRLEAFVGNAEKPVLEYTDQSGRPFLHGKIGFKSMDNASRYDSVRVYP